MNVKRPYRLYIEEGLAARRRNRKWLVREQSAEPRLRRANQEWAMEFIVDGLATGRMMRVLSLVDVYTRECLALEATPAFAASGHPAFQERGNLADLPYEITIEVAKSAGIHHAIHDKHWTWARLGLERLPE
jgi:hypothetical protein